VRQSVFLIVRVAAWGELLSDRMEREAAFEVVGLADDAEAGIAQVERLDPPPDIVLVDAGLEMARAPRARHGSARLVAVGLEKNPKQVLSWALAGATALVARTASLEELLTTLTGVARGESPCSPEVSGALLRGVGTAERAIRNGTPPTRLTDREWEVARLVEDGLTNKEIATRLQIEPGTVKAHVHNVIHKLGVSRRVQVGAALTGTTRTRLDT
jgi:two-component system, NarL family, nitrate/nitrite response regulator NarL